MRKRFVIAGGGTGGHIFPAIAIANAIKAKNPNAAFLFVGAKGKMEMEKVPQAGYKIDGIDIAGFNRSSLIKNIGLPFKLIKSFLQVRNIFRSFKPDTVIGVGGYSSFPVLRYAQQKGIDTFIHEQNSFAGKSNMLLGKRAVKVFVSTDGMEKFFPADKVVLVGNPVRSVISESVITREEGLKHFGLSADKKVLLSIGGSLGAKSINEAIAAGVETLNNQHVQLIWQTGKPFEERAKAAVGMNKNIWTSAFIREMEYAFAAADVVISRAGAMSIAELCVTGKPSVFVPYPFAAEDHQTVNAKKLVDKNAAWMITDAEAGVKLIETALELLNDEEKQKSFRSAMLANGIKDADHIIAKQILETK